MNVRDKKTKKKEFKSLDIFLSTCNKELSDVHQNKRLDSQTNSKDRHDSTISEKLSDKKYTKQEYLRYIIDNIVDINEAVKFFLQNINLPEIRSPPMPKIPITKIARPNSRILVITEKPKVALALAKALAGRNFKTLTYGKSVRYYTLKYGNYYVTIVPLKGHIIEYDTHSKYRSWFGVDPIELIKNEQSLSPKYKYPSLVRLLQLLARKHDILVIATDADEEGENIGWEASQIINQIKKLPTYRMWFLSMQPEELRHAFNNLTLPLESWALAPEARKQIDAFSGFAATRELTIAGRSAGGIISTSLGKSILSLGRVQSPTLYLLYLRERYIRNFRPRPYWTITASVVVNGVTLNFQHIESPFYNKDQAQSIFSKIKNAKHAKILTIETKTEQKKPNPPLNTNRALIMLNRILKLPANKAMKILEDLYLEGLITYPRTDTDKYPPNYDHKRNLIKLKNNATLGKLAQKALEFGAKLTRNGTKLIGDHLPITPIDIPKKLLQQLHQKVYELIVRRYLALFYPVAILEKSKIVIEINGEKFTTHITRIRKLGFWEVYPYDKPSGLDVILDKSSIVTIKEINIKENKTKPPSRLTEAELLKIMEKLGLGTKATRPEHIQKLIDRKYVIRKSNRLHLTELGYKISEFLEKIWPEFLQPYFSSYVLGLLRKIMNKELTLEQAVREARRKFLELFLRLRRSRKELKETLSGIEDLSLIASTRKKKQHKKRKKRRK